MQRSLAVVAILALTAAPAAAQHWLDAPRLYGETTLGAMRVVGDLDGDGDPDVAWASVAQVQPWLNTGNGEFQPGPASIPGVALEGQFASLDTDPAPLLADVNGDGKLDLVFAVNDHPTYNFTVLFGLGGAQFGSPVVVKTVQLHGTITSGVVGLALGDVDGNGTLDIGEASDTSTGFLVTDQQVSVRWWKWNGAGFTPSAKAVLAGSFSTADSLASLDANNDGVPDLVVGEDQGTRAMLLPTVAGNPTIGPVFQVTPILGAGQELTAGDLDGDGDVDVLSSTRSNPSYVLAALVNQGGGTFSAEISPTLDLGANSLQARPHLGDWNGDGFLDVLQCFDSLRIFRNDGTNHFALAVTIPTEHDSAFFGVGAGVADFNGDGALDFAAGRSITFGSGAFAPQLAEPFPPSMSAFLPHVAADWDDDGDVDFVFFNGRVAVNDGTGTFTASAANLWPAAPPFFSYAFSSAFDDFNGDGRGDHLTVYTFSIGMSGMFVEMRLLADDGLGKYVDAGAALPPGISISTLQTGGVGEMRRGVDVDLDGDLDLLDQNGYWPNNGSGFFPALVPLHSSAESLRAADVDGDGDVDILAMTPSGANTSYALQRNQGALTFVAEPLATATGLNRLGTFADLDDDGDLDVLVGSESNTVSLLENTGAAFAPPVVLQGAVLQMERVGAADIDGDGLTDVVTSRFNSSSNDESVLVFRRTGPGLVYEPMREWLAKAVQDLADVDGDGDLDPIGEAKLTNLRFHGPSAGVIRQYGSGVAGSGGVGPVIGATGPLHSSATTATLRIRRGLGNAATLIFSGLAEANFANAPLPGLTLYVDSIFFGDGVFLSGPAAPGAGAFTFPLVVAPSLAGLELFFQAFVLDPGSAAAFSATNGLQLRFGL